MSTGWLGVEDHDVLNPDLVQQVDQLADAAKAGRWAVVLELIESERTGSVNRWRFGGRSWFTPLHQAAWLGAPVEVVERMIGLGAWRSLRTADGDRPFDIAQERGHRSLLEALAVRDPSAREEQQFAVWDRNLTELIDERTRSLDAVRYRPVPTELLAIEQIELLWFPYPGMYGGFTISLHRNRIFVESTELRFRGSALHSPR